VSVTPTRRDVFLIDGRTVTPVAVPAVLIRDVSTDQLVKAEERWKPVRKTIREEIEQAGGWMEHAHWDWLNKVERMVKGQLLLSAVECGGEVQGLLAVAAVPRYSVLMTGEKAVYVDYVEVAPWNLRGTNSPPRYEGVGSVLLADAIRRSVEVGAGGRLGLHSLPSVEPFYRDRCRMTDLGTDPAYYGLRYFEYTAETATAWLTDHEGTS
jgi:hypothetical protein